MKKLKYSLFVIALLSTFAYTQNSNNNSTTFKVQMTVTERCDIETGQTQDIDFGTIQRSSSNLTAYGSLNVSCTEGTPYAITLHSDKALKIPKITLFKFLINYIKMKLIRWFGVIVLRKVLHNQARVLINH